DRTPGDGHRGRVRGLRPRPAGCERDAAVLPDRQRVRRPLRRATQPPGPLGLRGGVAAAGRARLRPRQRAGPGVHGGRGRRRPGQRHPDQRRPAVRRPRPPGVLHAGVHQPARHRAVGQGRRADHGRGVPAGGPGRPGAAADPALQEQHRQQGPVLRLPRELPDVAGDPVRRHRPAPHPVLRLPPGGRRAGPGRHRAGRPGRGLPAVPAGRLLRGRGGAGDHAQAPDHQHPGRAARRRRALPPAARDHRRREPVGDLHLPQGRHDLAGAGDDRGRLPHRRPVGGRAGRRAARGLPRPDAEAPAHAAVRADADRRPAADGIPGAGPQVRRGALRLRRRRADRRRAVPLGVGADPAGAGPDAVRPGAGLGGQAAAAGGLPVPRRPGLGLAPAAAGRPAVQRRPPGQGAVRAAGRPRRDAAAAHRGRGHPGGGRRPGGHPGVLPRRVPAPLPGAGRGGLLGLGDLRPGPRVAGPGADPGAAARHPRPRRRAAGPVPDRGLARRGAVRRI
ncbi:MAG: Pup ligase PafA' paralog, possible component of postulated heterodimer PafA-PafA', partial [uncultured Corynebacteriales bacterium]